MKSPRRKISSEPSKVGAEDGSLADATVTDTGTEMTMNYVIGTETTAAGHEL